MSYAPYAPPQHSQGHGGGYGPVYQYSPLGWKTTAAVGGIAGMLVVQPLQTALALVMADTLRHPTPEDLGVILLTGVVSLAQLVVSVCTYVFFLMWMHHAAKNVRAFGQQALTVTPGWAVGWWFVPFASIWMPFVAMREVWRASDPETVGPHAQRPWMSAPVPAKLGIWWATYILNGFLAMGIAIASMDFSGRSPVAGKPSAVSFLSHGLLTVAGVLIIIIIRELARRQEAAWERLSSGDVHGRAQTAASPYDATNPYVPTDTSNPYAPPRPG
ncbi:MAG: DUF4328 domain-containing protein [Labilithrix sp.]|nr:DUF4328 domain-containing protein [Labilithrix sp.]